MATKPQTFRPAGARSRVEVRREADARRGSARERGYTWQWDQASKLFLVEHPLCEYSLLDGLIVPAELVDHLYPHRGDAGLFWDRRFWVAASKAFHDGPKQVAERAGRRALDDLARRLGRPTRP